MTDREKYSDACGCAESYQQDHETINTINYRRVLTEIAMLGVGTRVDVVKESLEAISAATKQQGILKMNLLQPHNKHYSPMKIKYPTPYVDVSLEEENRDGCGLDCDLTFWAVQFKNLVENGMGGNEFRGTGR